MINFDIDALIKSGVDKDKLSADLKRLGDILISLQKNEPRFREAPKYRDQA